MKKSTFIHPKALVETRSIGEGSRVWAFAHILPKAKIGRNANICDHTFIENKVVLGDNVTVKCGVHLWDGVTAEDNVFIGPNAAFTNDLYPRSGNRGFTLRQTLLKKGCSIGANAVVLCGNTIGAHAMVGAGAVVTRDVPGYALCVGNPARVAGFLCACGAKLRFTKGAAACRCGKKYVKKGSSVRASAK